MLESAEQKLLIAALDAIQNRKNGPISLLLQVRLEFSAGGREFQTATDEPRIWSLLKEAPLSHDVIQRIGRVLRWFDAASLVEDWIGDTLNNTPERRLKVYEKLDLPGDVQQRMDELHGVMAVERPILIAEEHKDWYTEERKNLSAFYWRHLESYLENEWNDDDNLRLLDRSSDEIVCRLSDPLRKEAHGVRGLVVGYVQSGKTANFTSVIAKCVDAGYRLIIVLAGQWDILRQQTQRRLDKELCGKENIVRYASGGVHDYLDDKEWAAFVDHGGEPSANGGSDIVRLTTRSGDYFNLAQGISTLEMVGTAFPDRPFNDPENIKASPTKLVVIKKNASILDRFIGDLERLQLTILSDVPTLIIDDESDQASVNTKKPTKQEKKDRTAINKRLVKLLSMFDRGQYVGYTATPFANVFVDPEDQEDIYPRDFIYALERPLKHYMGVRDFFDVDDEGIILDEKDAPAGYDSNQRAYIRTFVEGKNDDTKLTEAILTFVLTGAVKLFREERGEIKARHHTMLVHRSHATSAHKADSELVQRHWDNLNFGTEEPHEALETLFDTSIIPISAAKAPKLSLPESYEDLRPYVNRCIRKIEGQEPYIRIINGTKRSMEEAPAFEDEDIWSILVGGTKLSRGYTVEGLTVSYFMRRSQQVDTLMQMGRWFGFRKGYRDLVRVYLQKGSKVKKRNMNLIAAFRAACMDEEALRSRLNIYKDEKDIRPIDVAPVVQSHLLVPTAKNKRYNAEIVNANLAGRWKYTTVSDRSKRQVNVKLFRDLLTGYPISHGELSIASPSSDKAIAFDAIWTILSPAELLDFIGAYKWPEEFKGFDEVRIFLRGTGEWDPEIDRWLLLAPQVEEDRPLLNIENGVGFKFVERTFHDERRFDAVTDPSHRLLAEFLAQVKLDRWPGDPEDNIINPAVKDIYMRRQGVFLFYPVLESGKIDGGRIKDSDVTVSVSLLFPGNRIKKRVAFSVVDATQKGKIVVNT